MTEFRASSAVLSIKFFFHISDAKESGHEIEAGVTKGFLGVITYIMGLDSLCIMV